MTEKVSVPRWFWVVGAIALVWNGMGVNAFLLQITMSPETLNALPAGERALYEDVPTWAMAAFAVAVWGGLFGSIALLMRKFLAYPIFIISLIGIVVQMTYNLFMSRAMDVYGPGGAIMPIMVLGIGIYLIWFSKKAAEKGWLNS